MQAAQLLTRRFHVFAQSADQDSFLKGDLLQLKALRILAAVIFFAARPAGAVAREFPDAKDDVLAVGALIGKFAALGIRLKGQGVTALFPGDAQFCAGLAPLHSMCGNASPTCACVSDQVGELMFQDPHHDVVSKLSELAIEVNG